MSDFDDYDVYDDEYYDSRDQITEDEAFPMLKKKKNKTVRSSNKKTLIKVGKHLIDPQDVAGISNVKNNLYVIRLFSAPNPTYATWATESEIGVLLKRFNIVVED